MLIFSVYASCYVTRAATKQRLELIRMIKRRSTKGDEAAFIVHLSSSEGHVVERPLARISLPIVEPSVYTAWLLVTGKPQ